MKNITLAALLLLSSAASASVDPLVMESARAMTEAMPDDEFCSVLGVSAYSLEGTPEDSIQRLTDKALNALQRERMRKWSNSQKDLCTRQLMASYKAELCSVEECD